MKLIHVQLSQNHMATTFEFLISCEESRRVAAEQILSEAHARVGQLEDDLSEFLADSPIFQLNQAAVGEQITLSASAIDLLDRCELLSESSDGFFDCTSKSATPERPQIAWDKNDRTAWKLKPGARVGFGAIGKGYALDQVRGLIEREGFTNFFLNAGGSSLILSGFSSTDVPWSWGWSWQKDAAGDPIGIPFTHTSGIPVAIGVSGTHEKGAHLLEPRTGMAVANGAKTALVAHPTATEADALSTALYVSGWERANHYMQKLLSRPAMAFIDRQGEVVWNGGFQKLWGSVAGLIVSLFFLASNTVFADDAVNLSDLGIEDFTPYLVERNTWWMCLPLAALGVVFVHLKKIKINTRPQPIELEDQK